MRCNQPSLQNELCTTKHIDIIMHYLTAATMQHCIAKMRVCIAKKVLYFWERLRRKMNFNKDYR